MIEWIISGWEWLGTGLLFVAIWVWRISKEHGKYKALQDSVDTIRTKQAICITQSEHDTMQLRCTEHIMHVVAEKFRDHEKEHAAEMKHLREDVSDLNGNICKIMGAMNIEPVQNKARRRDDK